MAIGLTSLSSELLHNVLINVDVLDLPNLIKTCRHFQQQICQDDLLWKRIYLRNFDGPSTSPESWREEFQRLVGVQKILESPDYEWKRNRISHVVPLIFDLVNDSQNSPHTYPSRNIEYVRKHFVQDARHSNVHTFMRQSSLFRYCGLPYDVPSDEFVDRQLSAKLHVFYGIEAEVRLSEIIDLRDQGAREIHPYARSRVYDLRNYNRNNFWGPFHNDRSERVDWEKVQAIFMVLYHGLRVLCERASGVIGPFWDQPFYGLAPNSYTSPPVPTQVHTPDGEPLFKDLPEVKFQKEQDELAAQDPYGVKGTWMRIINFLDYHELHDFNFRGPAIPEDVERPPINSMGAFRMILLQLWVTKIECPDESARGHSGTAKGMPIVHFAGRSRSLHNMWDPNANSHIRGYVRMTRHGDIRWTTFSVFNGEDRWRSEGVQIGGIRSARGVLGNWFNKDMEPEGPAGPTAFWKLNDAFARYKGWENSDEDDEDAAAAEVNFIADFDDMDEDDDDEDDDEPERDEDETAE